MGIGRDRETTAFTLRCSHKVSRQIQPFGTGINLECDLTLRSFSGNPVEVELIRVPNPNLYRSAFCALGLLQKYINGFVIQGREAKQITIPSA